MDFSAIEIGVILAGAFAGGFVSGLAGFGTGLTAVPIWILVLSPPAAAALAAAGGMASQLQTLHRIRHAIVWRIAGPIIAAGLVGVPIGTWALPMVDARSFKIGVGVILITYCSFMLLAGRWLASRASAATGGGPASRGPASRGPASRGPASRAGIGVGDLMAGLGGGMMSGLAGLSAPVPIIWTTFKPWSRDEKRGLIQAFNMATLTLTLVTIIATGLVSAQFWQALLVAIPGTLAGVQLGSAVYRRLDDRRFDRLVQGLLLAIGVILVLTNV